MAYFRRKRNYRKRRFAKRRVFKRRAPVKRRGLKVMVKRMIAKTEEVKCANVYSLSAQGLVQTPSASFITQNVYKVTPNAATLGIPQGTGQGQRVGNRITTKSCIWDAMIYPAPYDVTVNPVPTPQEVEIFAFRSIASPNSFVDPRPNFYQSGSTTRSMQGNLSDMMAPINRDQFRVFLRKRIKIGLAQSLITLPQQQFANNDFKMNQRVRLNLTKYVPKTVKFADAANDASTPQLWVMVVPVNADGTAASATTVPLAIDYNVVYKFTDA